MKMAKPTDLVHSKCKLTNFNKHKISAGIWTIPNQWIVFFARSNWLLKLGISTGYLLSLQNKMAARASNHLSSRVWPDKITFFVVGYSVAWYTLTQLFTSVSVNSDGYLPRLFGWKGDYPRARPLCFANQWIVQDLPSLSSQSERTKNTIHWFGVY